MTLPQSKLSWCPIIESTKKYPCLAQTVEDGSVPPVFRDSSKDTKIPPSKPNGGIYAGPQSTNPWANIPVTPSGMNLTHHNLRSANPPPGATEQYQGGDVFRVELELNLTDGRIFTKDDVNGGVAGGSFFRSPFQYRLTIVGCPPRPGTYTINMTDAYGDGWQSTTADDGPGIQVFADGILIAEVGICTDYNDSQDAWCSGGGSSGSDTIDIPDGVENLEWIFPGDFWGEMGFEILGPEGQVLYTAAEGSQAEGEFFVVLCRFD